MTEEGRDLRDAKHPYVTLTNAKVHLIFSIIIIVMSLIQMFIGIAISEEIVKEITWYGNNGDSWRDSFESYFYGDSIWISFVGFILAALGLSVWKTRSRANGIMLSVMLFISGFVLYPVSGALAGSQMVWTDYDGSDGIHNTRVVSAIFSGITAIVVLGWAFYASFHACCNSKVRKQRRLNMPAPGTQPMGGQPQVVYVQAPNPGYAQQPGAYIQQPGGYIQQPGGYVQQPGGYVQQQGGYVQQPGGYIQQQPVYIAQGPPQYTQQPQQQPQYTQQQPGTQQYTQQQPGVIQQVQVPPQVQHGGATAPLPGTPDTTSPPSYAE